jgi:hypothetical protein
LRDHFVSFKHVWMFWNIPCLCLMRICHISI